MKIRYEVSIKDQIAVHQRQTTTQLNSRSSRRATLAISGFMALLGLFVGVAQGLWSLSAIVLFYSIFLFFFPRLLALGISATAVKTMFKGDNARGVLGLHELEITADGFTDRTEWKETKYAWALLDHIETEGDHTFLTFGKLNVIVIPHHAVTDGSLPAFLKTLGEHYTPEAAGKTLALTND